VSVFDEKSGTELARVRTRRKVVHGVVVSPDDRYAFISVEGVAAEPGTVEVIDLASLTIVASVDVGPQAGGIDIVRVAD
jgi:DNA-binding beta-propeller fold protein YncE